MAEYKNIILQEQEEISILSINRPEKLNALNKETIAELHAALQACNKNTATKAIVLTGAGTKAFVAGADISEFADFSVNQGQELSKHGHEILFDFIENMKKPVLAAINGFALGGGLELAMSCHIRIASVNAKMGLPEVSLGVIPGYGGTQRLPQLVGKGKAMEMICTAEMINAETALQYGLVNYVVEQEVLIETAIALAKKITKNSSVAISFAIKAVNAGFQSGANGYAEEIKAFGDCFGTEDFKEGTTAFLNKRKPLFPGK
jgi:enoyl-CoA hydratase